MADRPAAETGTKEISFKKPFRFTLAMVLLVMLLFAGLVINANTGSVSIPASDVFRMITRGFYAFTRNILTGGKYTAQLAAVTETDTASQILFRIRLPRVLLAALLGGALSVSGYLLQVFFRNPIAGPFVLGISSGAKMVVGMTLIFLIPQGSRSASMPLMTAAFLGSMLGIAAGLALAHLFGWLMHVNGATLPFAQALLYSGYESLDLQDIFIGAMVLAASGAVMDLAMDIASGIDEVALRRPELPARELFRSGVRIGRSVVGTMTTTLLLAYSGGYLTLLMVFAAQGTHPRDFLNSPLVSAEIVKTLIGSFSLVLVAPFTAAVGARILRRR